MKHSLLIALAFATAVQTGALAQRSGSGRGNTEGPWFGLMLPPHFGQSPAVLVGPRSRPVTLPTGEPAAPEFDGAALRRDLETIVAFSKESRATHEIGSGQLWGRVSGLPSGKKTIDWAAAQFRAAGIADVRVQRIQQAADAGFWFPLEWEVRLLGDPAFGAGSQDVVLESAMPLRPSDVPDGTLTAPLVFVGSGNPSVVEHLDVRDKIAVMLVIPQGHTVFERANVTARARVLRDRGAIGVFNLVRQPGNEHSFDMSCGDLCVNIGGHDGWFLEQAFDRAAAAGVADKLRARIAIRSETRRGLSAENAVAVLPGRSSEETLVVDAHGDAWFDGAGDNADGFSIMIALARHFARPENRTNRRLVFIASAGHHSAGINGPRGFRQANPELEKAAVVLVNVEHVAQRNFSPARSTAPDGYRDYIADSGEAPIYAGISQTVPFLHGLMDQGVERYGVNFVSERSDMGSGEIGGFTGMPIPLITLMQSPPLYHTTGETEEVISTPGLERMARFLAYFLNEVDRAPLAKLKP
jgi:hypothetical protein